MKVDEKYRGIVEKIISVFGDCPHYSMSFCMDCPLGDRDVTRTPEETVEKAKSYLRALDNARIDAEFLKYGVVVDEEFRDFVENANHEQDCYRLNCNGCPFSYINHNGSCGDISGRGTDFNRNPKRKSVFARYIERLDELKNKTKEDGMEKTKVQVIVGDTIDYMREITQVLHVGGIVWADGTVGKYRNDCFFLRYINNNNEGRIEAGCSDRCKMIADFIENSKSTTREYEYIIAEDFLKDPTIIRGWKKPETHKITIDDKEIELSKESYENIKKALIGDGKTR